MKLLIITQKVDKNDPVLGFFHSWIIKFAESFESVVVICLYKGEYNFPSNIKVLSLGKEKGVSRIKYVLNFFTYIWSERKDYDKVFVHMNQVYVLLGGIIWKILGKEIFLWYTHKSVTLSLRAALLFVKKVFSASQESFRIPTNKLRVMGHGIPLDLFAYEQTKTFNFENIKLVTVGRISRSKDLRTLIDAANILNATFDIIGGPLTSDDRIYYKELEKFSSDKIIFRGSKKHEDITPYIKKADIFVHASATGSLDKAPLEAMACGTPVISCNDSFIPILSPCGLTFKKQDPQSLVMAIRSFELNVQKDDVRLQLRNTVAKQHSLDGLIKGLSNEISHE